MSEEDFVGWCPNDISFKLLQEDVPRSGTNRKEAEEATR